MTNTPTGVTVLAQTGADPCPRFELTITLGADNVAVTVYREANGERTLVRGAWKVPASGSALIVDYENFFGVNNKYVVIGYDINDIPSAEYATTNYVMAVTRGWVQDPLNPGQSMEFRRADGFAAARSFDVEQSLLPVMGRRRLGMMSDQRRPTDNDYSIVTLTQEETDKFRSILTEANPLLFRCPASWDLGNIYVAVPSGVETRWAKDITEDSRIWQLNGTEVDGPSPFFQVTYWTWDDVVASQATWNALVADKATWVDVVRNPT